MNPIPYARQSINEEDIAAVVSVLRSDFLTQGPAIEQFERRVAEYCGARYAVAVSSATAGLHLGCLALGFGPGDRLWTSPNTFVASSNCALYCGGLVDFVDIDARTYNLSIPELERRLTQASRAGNLPKVLVPVHFGGQSCEMERIAALAQRYGFAVMEDAAHAIGGRYGGMPIGNNRFSDLTVFSFHPVKIITSGEGGMILTNRDDLYQKLIRLRSHGITRQPQLMEGESHGPWYYQQIELGFHYRMTDLQAALGLSQMNRLDEFVARRRALSKRYDELLRALPVTLPWQHPDTESSWHLYVIRLASGLKKPHRRVFEEMRAAGILVNLHYIPVHTQPHYRRLGFRPGSFPEAEAYYKQALTLPLYYDLSHESQDYVVSTLARILA